MSSRCLCFNISDKSEYDLWSNTHLPKPEWIEPNCIAIKPWQGCDECSEAYYQRGSREQHNLWALKTYERKKQKLDDELEEYFNLPVLSPGWHYDYATKTAVYTHSIPDLPHISRTSGWKIKAVLSTKHQDITLNLE